MTNGIARRDLENSHVVLWLLKDTSWCRSWHWLGMLMVAPTLAVQLVLFWRSRKDPHEAFHNAAVACWICANAVWMTGEFFFNDHTRIIAQWFFYAGLASTAFYYLAHFGKRKQS